jgi:hypothetical protein
MFTVFHVSVLVGIGGGVALGWTHGTQLYGPAGGLAAAVASGYAGFLVGRLPELVVLWSLCGSLASKTSDQLHALLHGPDCQAPNLVLLELQRRGEDVRSELGLILDLLVSEDFAQRGRGWAAMSSAFPDLAGQARDYHLGDSVGECRRKTEALRHMASEFMRPDDR